MDNTPKDCSSRKIGSRARAILHYQIDSDNWIYREETGNDVGRDCVIELSDDNQWNNDKIEGQIKGAKSLRKLSNGDYFVCCRNKNCKLCY